MDFSQRLIQVHTFSSVATKENVGRPFHLRVCRKQHS